MTASLQPYPEYKDSGMPWLGEVPKHWDCLPHRAVFEEIKEQGHVDEPLLSVTISKGIILQADLLANSSKKDSSNLDKTKYKLVKPGDIAYNKMRAWQGAVGVSRHQGIVSPAYIVVRLRGADNPDFFHFLLRTTGFAKEAERWSYGITSDMWSLRPEHFKMIYSCVPSRPEQDAIVTFLQQFDTKVRRFVRNRQRLIEVLNEQKQTIINRVVTRGLDLNTPLKPSGIDWLGDIPGHWKPVRLGRVIDLLTGFPFKSSGFTDAHTDIRLLRGINVSPGRIRWDSVVRWPKSEAAELSPFALEEGDIVFGMDRPVISGGIRLAIVTNRDVTSLLLQRVARLRARPELDQAYLAILLHDRRYADYLAPIFTGISVPHISPAQISDYRVALPPVKEQQRIVEHVTEQTRSIEIVIDRGEREIDLIREYRTRLIADVVTGKLDVRNLAPATGEEPSDAELEDMDEGIDDEKLLGNDELELIGEATNDI